MQGLDCTLWLGNSRIVHKQVYLIMVTAFVKLDLCNLLVRVCNIQMDGLESFKVRFLVDVGQQCGYSLGPLLVQYTLLVFVWDEVCQPSTAHFAGPSVHLQAINTDMGISSR